MKRGEMGQLEPHLTHLSKQCTRTALSQSVVHRTTRPRLPEGRP